MRVSIIAALGSKREIGANNDLLWHLPADMYFFKEKTYWHHVIMGRRNYESIPARYRPLPDRTNIIISRQAEYDAPECYVVPTLEEALAIPREWGEHECFIIGGAQIYDLALKAGCVHTMFLTHVEGTFPHADTFFPEFDESEWEVSSVMSTPKNVDNYYAFEIKRYDHKTLKPETPVAEAPEEKPLEQPGSTLGI